jgi:type VI protein secretion system component VasA
MIAFGRTRDHTDSDGPRIVSLRLLATNGRHAERLRAGDLVGSVVCMGRSFSFRSLLPSSPYVAPPMADVFALRALRAAAVPAGQADALASLQHALLNAIPSGIDPVLSRALQLRVEGLRELEVTVARRRVDGMTVHGYAYRLVLDEAAFRGPGDIGLFGAALSEALSRSMPIHTFVELTVVGLRAGARSVHRPRRRG